MINKEITVSGEIATPLLLDIEGDDEKFYQFILSTEEDGVAKAIPVIISERLIDVNKNHTGENVTIKGLYKCFYKDGLIPSIAFSSVSCIYPNEIWWD